MPPLVRALIDFGPLVAFFVAYKFYGIIAATAVVVILSVLGIVVTYYYDKKVPMALLFTTGLLVVFGAMTIFTGNPTFIKIKPTIVYLILAMFLLFGLARNKLFLKNILEQKLQLSEEEWVVFSKRWAYFFVFLALLNEFIWRNFSEDFWVKFKAFGFISIIFIFVYTQRSFFIKGKK